VWKICLFENVCIKASGLKFVVPEILKDGMEKLQILGTLRTFDWLGFKDKFLSPSNLVTYKPLANNVSRRIQGNYGNRD
jgi:hypothetical protein